MKSHDVRRMRACDTCGELGIVDAEASDALPGLVRVESEHHHPGCVDLARLLALPRNERNHVRMCDVTPDVMRALLASL